MIIKLCRGHMSTGVQLICKIPSILYECSNIMNIFKRFSVSHVCFDDQEDKTVEENSGEKMWSRSMRQIIQKKKDPSGESDGTYL